MHPALSPRPASAFLALLALCLLPAPAGAKSACNARATAVLSGSETVGGGFFSTQNIVMVKRSGAGAIGAWKVTDWTYTQTIAPGTPPSLRAVLAQAISQVAVSEIPGLDATCTTDLPGGDTIRIACTGTYLILVHADGRITPNGGDTVLGHLTPASGANPAQLTLSMIPMNPMYQGRVTGSVAPSNKIGFHTTITAAYSYLDPVSATYKMRFSIEPYNSEAADNLSAGADFSGYRQAHTRITSGREGPEAFVDIRLEGSPTTRADMAGDTMIHAETVYDDCTYRSEWSLLELMMVYAVTP